MTKIMEHNGLAIELNNGLIVKAVDGRKEVELTALDECEIYANYLKYYRS